MWSNLYHGQPTLQYHKGLGLTGTSVVGEAGKGATLKQVTCHCAPFSHAVIKALKVIVVFLSSEEQNWASLQLSLFGPSPHNSRERGKGVYLSISIQTLDRVLHNWKSRQSIHSVSVSVHEQILGQASEASFDPWQKRVLRQHATVYLEVISTRGINHGEAIKNFGRNHEETWGTWSC